MGARESKELAERAACPLPSLTGSSISGSWWLARTAPSPTPTCTGCASWNPPIVGDSSVEAIAGAIRDRRFSLAFLDGTQYRWASLPPLTYAEVADQVGVPLEFVLAFEEALRKVRPAPDGPAPRNSRRCSRPRASLSMRGRSTTARTCASSASTPGRSDGSPRRRATCSSALRGAASGGGDESRRDAGGREPHRARARARHGEARPGDLSPPAGGGVHRRRRATHGEAIESMGLYVRPERLPRSRS
jgi:hypothetical protein